MISDDDLAALLPSNIEPSVELPTGDRLVVESFPQLPLARWSYQMQLDLAQYIGAAGSQYDAESIGDPIMWAFWRSMFVGFGIVDWLGPYDGLPFPIKNGFRLGIALYLPEQIKFHLDAREEGYWHSLPRADAEYSYPIAIYGAEYKSQFAPRKSSSSILGEINGTPGLVTAAHCVRGKGVGSRVSLFCSICGAKTMGTIISHGGPYVDAVFVAAQDPPGRSCCSSAGPLQGTIVPTTGLQIANHFTSSPTSVASTVFEGVLPPPAVLSSVMPRNFLTTIPGKDGDSGSLITDAANVRAAGMHLGETGVRLGTGVTATRPYALDLWQPISMFNINMQGGFIR